MDYDNYYGEEKSSGFSDYLEGAGESFNRFKVLIFLGLVLLLALAWFFFLVPKPASLSVSFTALDSGPVSGVVVDLVDEEDNLVASDYSDDSGTVFLPELPSGKALFIEANAGGDFKSVRKSIELGSGEQGSLEIVLEKNFLLELETDEDLSALPIGCAKEVAYTVSNKGSAPVTVELVGDGDFADAVSSTPVTVASGSAEEVVATFSIPKTEPADAQKAGGVRVKYSRVSHSFSSKVVSAPNLAVSPETISGTIVAGGESLKKQITVTNTGAAPLSISKDDVEMRGDFADGNQFDAKYFWTLFSDDDILEPGSEVVWWISFEVPEYASGVLVGDLRITTPCKKVSVPVSLTVSYVE